MKNEYAVVTGASSGMGVDFAKELANRGYNLVLVARRTDRLETLQQEIMKTHKDADIHVVSLDLIEPDSADKLLAYVQMKQLNVSVLVNNAGFGTSGDFLSVPLEKSTQMLQLNIVTLTRLTYLFATEMKKKNNGYILQVSSVGAFQPSPGFAAYSATKSYVMLFSEALNHELKGTNVSITTLYPGATKTEFFVVADQKLNKLVTSTLMTAAQVANIGLNAMFKRKRAIIRGIINKLSSIISQMSPRGIVIWSAANVMK